jgi:hypothetical protein
VGNDKPTPFGVDCRNIGEKRQKGFESGGFTVGLARRKTQSISVYRSRAHAPELNNVLWRYANAITRTKKTPQGSGRVRVNGVSLINTAKQKDERLRGQWKVQNQR